ncbi:hypothetical protein L9F63_018153 [Diploptera punctata]|uniref:Uncharacterized protein n=1 Tax=Diploptera punctata TaxID=6984 RepID=A0AAD7ZYD3_DIPPU|nr:hypothetical protein L9F63_018153 [Diploptera punctata]
MNPRVGMIPMFSGAILMIGLLLSQQVIHVNCMTLQHVPGTGGRNSGDPAPGRSPGPPIMLDSPANHQAVSTVPIVRHRSARQLLPEEFPDDISYQESTVVSSSSNYREDVTQENTRPTLEEDEFPLERYSSGARLPDPIDSSEEESILPKNAFTIQEAKMTWTC